MKDKKASIQKNYIYNLLYDIFALIVPFVTTPYISRVLSIDSMGVYGYSHSIVMYFTAFVALGTKSYAIKTIAQSKDEIEASYVFWNTFLLRVISGILTLVTYYLCIGNLVGNISVALIQSIYVIAVIFDISWFFQGLENFKIIVIRNALFKLISVILIFIFVKSDGDFHKYLCILSGAALLGNISLWTCLAPKLQKIKIGMLKPLNGFKEIIVLFIPTLALQIYSATGSTMLGAICKDMSQNGYYEQANKIIGILLTAITSLSIVALPRVSNLFINKEYNKIQDCMQNSYRFVMLLSFPMSFGLNAVSDKFIPWFLGEGYTPAIPVLSILSILFFIMGASNITGVQYLVATNRQAIYSMSIVIGVIVNIIANIVLIPKFSAIGVAIAAVISNLFVYAIQIIYVVIIKKELPLSLVFAGAWRYLSGSFLMSLVIGFVEQFTGKSFFGLIIDIVIGMIIYFLFVMLTKDQMVLSYAINIISKCRSRRIK